MLPKEAQNSSINGDFVGQTDFSAINIEDKLRRHNHDGVESEKMNDGMERIELSFETDEQVTLNLYVPFSIRIFQIRGRTTKAIAATDDGTVTAKDYNGNTMGTLTASASTVINTDLTAQAINTNNKIPKDQFYSLVSAKSTVGGKVMVSVEYERYA